MIPIHFLVAVAFTLFILGALMVLLRRNILLILMGLELMLNAGALLFITFSRMHAGSSIQMATEMGKKAALSGHLFTLFLFVIAAVEVALMIAIILNIFKLQKSLLTSSYTFLKQ